ncbi:MAG: ABC transporter permease [Rudaea sp.]
MFSYYLALAWHRCRQNPLMVVLLVLTMAIGIASCMTAMTIFAALSGEPLPGISDHLYVATMDAREVVDKDRPGYDKSDSLLNLRDAKALVDAHRARTQVALAISYARAGDLDGKITDEALGLIGYGPVLGTLGVPLSFGRTWTAAEQASHDPVVVIDTNLAQKLFGKEDAVGLSLNLDAARFRVIGVFAPWKSRTQFIGLTQNRGGPLGRDTQFFVPAEAALDAGVGPQSSGECGKDAPVITLQSTNVGHCRWLDLWVALDTRDQVARYTQFLSGYAQVQHDAGRFVYPPQPKLYSTLAWMDLNRVVPDDVGLNMLLAGGFLLLCMVNVAGLLAARFLRRQADVAIRRALGASQRDVFTQHVVEAGLLGVAGGLFALPLTFLGVFIVRMQPVAYAEAAHFSVGVFFSLLLFSLAVGLLVGILPAWRVCRQPPAMQIKVA